MKTRTRTAWHILAIAALSALTLFATVLPGKAADTATLVDAAGRRVTVPVPARRVICSGAGCLRLLTYLQATDRVVAVDSMEKTPSAAADPRPYALAHPELAGLPLSGEFRGMDNPELIAAIDPQPQVIFKTFASMGHDPAELQEKTGIPVVVLQYGNLADYRRQLDESLRLMGRVLGKADRAEAVIAFFDEMIADLDRRTADVAASEKKTCYVGGIAYKGPHGFRSTEPDYPPFVFTRARHPAHDAQPAAGPISHAQVAREQILAWDPDVLFLDLSSTVATPGASALDELRRDPAYRHLDAVRKGNVFGVMPYNAYAQNYDAIFANAYFVGKVLYPDRFSDIRPSEQADRIFAFLVGQPVFDAINAMFADRVFDRVLQPKDF